MKKGILLFILIAAIVGLAGVCIATAIPSSNIVDKDQESMLTKTYTVESDGVVITLVTNEITQTATANVVYGIEKSFENDNMFRVAVSIAVATLQDPEDANDKIAILSKTTGMQLESPIKNTEIETLVSLYDVGMVTVSGYVNGEKTEVTYTE